MDPLSLFWGWWSGDSTVRVVQLVGLHTASVTILVFLAGTAWTWVVASNLWTIVHYRCNGLTGTGVSLCCLCLLTLGL